MEGGDPGTYRQIIKDAANGEADELDPTVRRMIIAMANKADAESKKIDRVITLLITTSVSFGLLATSLVGSFLFGRF